MESSWFKNDGDGSEGDDGESAEGGAGESEINLGTLGGTDGLPSSEKFELMKLKLQMQEQMQIQREQMQLQIQKEVKIEKIKAEK